MKRLLPAVLLFLLAADAARSAPVPPEPSAGLPPDVTIVRKDGADLIVDVTTMIEVPVTVEMIQVIDGKRVQAIITTMRAVPKQFQRSVPLKDVRGWTVDGKPIDADTLARRLERPTVVVISRDGRPLTPAFRGILRDDAIVLVLPGEPLVVDPPPPPRPRPPEKVPEPLDKKPG